MDTVGQTIIYCDEDLNTTVINITDLETLTVMDTVGQTIRYQDKDGAVFVIDITQLATLTVMDTVGQTLIYTDEDGGNTVVDIAAMETNTTMTNLISGNRIGVFNNQDSTAYDIDETITELSLLRNMLTLSNGDNFNGTID